MKTAIIIDGPNLWGMTQILGQNINFKAFLKHVRGPERKIEVMNHFYDVSPIGQPNPNHKNAFVLELQELGFKAIPVPLKFFAPNDRNRKISKSRTDQAIIVELAKYLWQRGSERFEHLILVAGDSDYEFILEEYKREGRTVEVWAIKAAFAPQLQRVADEINFFENHKYLLMRQNGRDKKAVGF